MAETFVDTFGTTSFPMLWDSTFQSWTELGIRGQPAAMMLTPNGGLIERWSGAIPESTVLNFVDQLANA